MKKKYLSKIIFLCILLSCFFVSFLFYRHGENIIILKDLYGPAVLYLSFILLLLSQLLNNKFNLNPKNHFFITIIVIYYIYNILSLIMSPFKFYSIEEIYKYGFYILTFIVLYNILNTRKRFMNFFIFLFICTSLIILYAIIQTFGYDFIDWGIRPRPIVSTFGNKNFLAGFLGIIFPINLSLSIYYINKKKLIQCSIFILLSILSAYLIYKTKTRGVWLAVIIELILLFIIYNYILIKKNKKKLFIYLYLFIIIFFIGLFLFIPDKHIYNIKNQISSIFQTTRGTNAIRWKIWQGTNRIIRDNTLFGTGIGTFQLVFPFYRPADYHQIGVSHNTRHSHFEYLEIWAETGIIGLGLWLLFLFSLVFYLLKKIQRDIFNNFDFYIALQLGILIGIIGFIIDNLTGVNFRWITPSYYFFVIAALGITAGNFSNKNIPMKKIKSYIKFPLIIFCTLFLCFFAFFFSYLIKIFYGDLFLKATGIYNRQSQYRNAIKACNEAIKFNPYDMAMYYKLAYAYLSLNDIDNAYHYYNKTTGLAPRYTQIFVNVGFIYYKLFEKTKNNQYLYNSIYYFSKANDIENSTQNNSRLADLYRQIGLKYQAIYHNKQALYIIPTDVYLQEPGQKIKKMELMFNNIAGLYFELHKIDKAVSQYKLIANLNQQKHYDTFEKLATILFRKKLYDKCIEVYEKILKYYPNDFRTIFNIGVIHTKLNNLDKKYEYFYKALIKIEPDKLKYKMNRNILNTLTTFFNRQKNKREHKADTLDALGYISYLNSNISTAKDYFQQAVKINNTNTIYKKHLSIIK